MTSIPSPDLMTPAGRIGWLLIHVWAGNMRRMAEEVGLTHTVISKIVNVRQGPGRRVLAAVAGHPRVNPAWLYEGQGEPLLAARQEMPGDGWPVPIARVILPGLPADHRGMLTGMTFPVAGAHYGAGRYFYEVPHDDPIVDDPAEKVAAGDLVLLEADDRVWKGNRKILVNKLVVVRSTGDGGIDYRLVRWGSARMAELVSPIQERRPKPRIRQRAIDLEDSLPPPVKKVEPTIDDIIAICVLSIRQG